MDMEKLGEYTVNQEWWSIQYSRPELNSGFKKKVFAFVNWNIVDLH